MRIILFTSPLAVAAGLYLIASFGVLLGLRIATLLCKPRVTLSFFEQVFFAMSWPMSFIFFARSRDDYHA